jgi:hypothetical protein
METKHNDPLMEDYLRYIDGLVYGPGFEGTVRLTKKLLMGLTERHWIQSNCFGADGWLFSERVAPAAQRDAQWHRLRSGAGLLCYVWDTSVPGACNGGIHPWLDAAWTIKEGEGQ